MATIGWGRQGWGEGPWGSGLETLTTNTVQSASSVSSPSLTVGVVFDATNVLFPLRLSAKPTTLTRTMSSQPLQ